VYGGLAKLLLTTRDGEVNQFVDDTSDYNKRGRIARGTNHLKASGTEVAERIARMQRNGTFRRVKTAENPNITGEIMTAVASGALKSKDQGN